ncbi:MAG: GTP 3',8-cyclase [Desulfovibrio sp.]
MKYCDNMLHHLMLFDDCIAPCCPSPFYPRIYPMLQYKGGELNLYDYRNYITATIKAMNEDERICAGCPSILECDASLEELMDKFTIKGMTINVNKQICNLSCVYCYNFKLDHKPDYYDYRNFIDILSKSDLVDLSFIAWIGGEPTLGKGFHYFCKKFNTLGYKQHFFTNAVIYSQEIAASLSSGLGYVLISIDSGSRVMFNTIKGCDKYHEVSMNIKKYAKVAQYPESVHLKYIITEQNANFFEIVLFLLHCVSIRAYIYTINMDTWKSWTINNTTESCVKNGFVPGHAQNSYNYKKMRQDPDSGVPAAWVDLAACGVGAGAALGLKSEPPGRLLPKYLERLIQSMDIEAFAREQGFPGFEEFVLPLLADAARELGEYLEYDYWEGFPAWVRNGEKCLFVADINTRENFATGLEHIRADHGDKAFLLQPYVCTFVPREGSLDCSLDEYRFRKCCIRWGHLFNDQELREAFSQAPSASALERLLRENAQTKYLATLQAKAEELRGREVLFWGCGAAYEAHKGLFSETTPKAVLLSPAYAQKERRTHINGLPIRSTDSVREQEHSLPVIVFTRPEHARAARREVETLFNQASVIYALSLEQCSLRGGSS